MWLDNACGASVTHDPSVLDGLSWRVGQDFVDGLAKMWTAMKMPTSSEPLHRTVGKDLLSKTPLERGIGDEAKDQDTCPETAATVIVAPPATKFAPTASVQHTPLPPVSCVALVTVGQPSPPA